MLSVTRGLRALIRPREAEASLWRRLRYENQLQCRERLFDLYAAAARAIARGEYRRRPSHGLEPADFEQLAYGGLLEAIDRFDPMRGAPFEAFARLRIRGAISDGLARSSEGAAQHASRRRAELDRLRSLAPAVDADPVTGLSDLAVSLAIGLVVESARVLELDENLEAPDLNAYESIAWRELQLSVFAEIERLPQAERTVMRQHYFNEVPFGQIADLLGVSKGRVSQLHRAALQKVRDRLRTSM